VPFDTRRATESDVPALVRLVNSAYRGDSSRLGWTTEADLLGGVRIDAERLLAAVRMRDHVILVHERDDAIVACVHLQRTGDECYLGMLTTTPELQNAGLGRQMIEAAETWAVAQWRSRAMHMTVIVQRTELIRWYERRGYSVTGERKPFPYGDSRFGEPTRPDLAFHVLRKVLTPS
jgi:ribosomal protein S18 acetylase RimI-like enzyme